MPRTAAKQEKKLRSTEELTEAELVILQSYIEILDNNQIRVTKTLEDDQYERIKLLFERLGGVYLPGRRRFEFSIDPTPLLTQTIAQRVMPKQNPLDFFYSPAPVVDALFCELEWGRTMEDLIWKSEHEHRHLRVLESSAGLGHLADAFRQRYPTAVIDVCEIDPYRRAVLRQKGYRVVSEDALQYHPLRDDYYDLAFLNPPFTIEGDTFTFIKHIRHAYGLLIDHPWSKLVSVVPAQLSQGTRYQDFYIQVLQYGSFEDLHQQAFAEAGTKVEAAIISLQKQKNHFYANWDQSDDGYPNLRLKEAWTYIGVDEKLNRRHDSLINDMVEGRLPVYTTGEIAPQTRAAIHTFCEQVCHRLLSEYRLYIPLVGNDLVTMEEEIVLQYQRAREDYGCLKTREWQWEQQKKKSALHKKIEQSERLLARSKEEISAQERQIIRAQGELQELEASSQIVPIFAPAAEINPPGLDPQRPQLETLPSKQDELPASRVPSPERSVPRSRYVQFSLFE